MAAPTDMGDRITIIGQGLAGTCLAWRLHARGAKFLVVDRESGSGSSRAAAGLVTPVTGKGMNPSWQLERFLAEARGFYRALEELLGGCFYHEVPIVRLFRDDEERGKFEGKREELGPWVGEMNPPLDPRIKAPHGGVTWNGSGWLDTRAFLDASREFFARAGCYESRLAPLGDLAGPTVACLGAAGLGEGPFGFLPERRAKGEILTVKIPGLQEERIVSRGGWLIPLGEQLYRVGATYGWDDLSEQPTGAGRAEVEELIRSFTDLPFEVMEHVAGVRPIVRRSQPVIGVHPERDRLYCFNGLGSKGVLYAPGVAECLAAHLVEGAPIESELDLASLFAL